MMGLLYKDNATILTSYKKNAILVLVVYGLMAFAMDMPFMLYAMVFLTGLYTAATLNFDEASHWDAYARTLPLSAAQIVGEKYILSVIWELGGAVLAFVLSTVYAVIKGRTGFLAEQLIGILGVLAVVMLYNALAFPLSYKYGASRARVNVMVALVVLCCGVPFLLNYLMEQGMELPFLQGLQSATEGQVAVAVALAVVAVLVLCGVSFAISVRIYEKKEL